MLYTGTIVRKADGSDDREYVVEMHDTHAGMVKLEGRDDRVPAPQLQVVRDPFDSLTRD